MWTPSERIVAARLGDTASFFSLRALRNPASVFLYYSVKLFENSTCDLMYSVAFSGLKTSVSSRMDVLSSARTLFCSSRCCLCSGSYMKGCLRSGIPCGTAC